MHSMLKSVRTLRELSGARGYPKRDLPRQDISHDGQGRHPEQAGIGKDFSLRSK